RNDKGFRHLKTQLCFQTQTNFGSSDISSYEFAKDPTVLLPNGFESIAFLNSPTKSIATRTPEMRSLFLKSIIYQALIDKCLKTIKLDNTNRNLRTFFPEFVKMLSH
ncbi:hypothetical protein, partial [Scytonema sp. UIC 10036]|uniref:hypothetical protein n=1 Tax=Scytonema sp. UIC 10036 TaxID=2304196 RepID=UPI001A9ABBA2